MLLQGLLNKLRVPVLSKNKPNRPMTGYPAKKPFTVTNPKHVEMYSYH